MRFSSLKYFFCNSRRLGSRISSGASTWAGTETASKSAENKSTRTTTLVARIEDSLRAIGRIAHGPKIRDQGVDLSFRQGISVGWNRWGGFIEERRKGEQA